MNRLILVVEDDEAILRTIEQILTDEGGYVVAAAPHGKEALELVKRAPPGLILLDMKMPVMDGWAFATAYRQLPGPHAPIIALTAAHDSRARAAEIAAETYIAKPFDVDALLDVVRRFFPLA